MNECIGCKFYDSSVDCCNADEHCYVEGYKQGRKDGIEECINAIKERWIMWSIGVIKAIIDTLQQLKEQKNECG